MQVTYLGIAASASSHSKHFQAYITAMDGNFLSRFINQRSITMKKVISVILMMAFAVCSYAANNSDPSKVFFKNGSCHDKNELCEFEDFNGKAYEFWFSGSIEKPEESVFNYVPFYVGDRVEGILFIKDGEIGCDFGLCQNVKGEIVGLDPKWYAFSDAYANQNSTQQPTQQSSEPPYKLSGIHGKYGDYIFEVISKVNGLEVKAIIVNEGNCKVTPYGENKKEPLKMGEEYKAWIFANCNVINITVVTNMGSWTHSS